MYKSYAGKELKIHELFAMEAIFMMLQREEISKEDTEMKLEKLLTEKNEKKELEAPKNTRTHETNTGKEIVINRSKSTKFSQYPGRIEHSEENITEAARLQEARSILKTEQQKTTDKEEEIQLNRELAKALLKRAEIAPREEKNKNEIQMIQELAKICLEQAEMAQRENLKM